ncbi:MAG: division/cell wall cluster transcriptional repressor MraZ [Terriglobia bacterium]
MLRGRHTATVDIKGRLKIPTEFKALLDEKYGPDFYITSLDGKHARVYPFPEWRKIEDKLFALPSMNGAKKKFLDRANYWGQMGRSDGQGRILIPSQLRESADLRGEVAVIGYLERLDVWSITRFEEYLAQTELTQEDAKTLSDLGI